MIQSGRLGRGWFAKARPPATLGNIIYMADEQQEIKDRHFQTMKYLQEMRDDVKRILQDTIDRHYDFPATDSAGETAERTKLKADLREVQRRIDRTLQGL